MQWLVYSPQDLAAARTLDRELSDRLDDHITKNDVMTAWTCIPSDRFPAGTTPPKGARTVYIVDDPPTDLSEDPVAVSMLRMLIERSGALAVDWGGKLQPARDALTMLASEPFDEVLYKPTVTAAPAGAAAKQARGGQSLSERVLESFNAALEDMERGIELKEALEEASEPARLWLEHVVRHNAPEDAVVDAALALPPERAARIHREVEALLSDLWK
jgi:hypothetical protein